jgi:uncharacterized protein (TIGR02145 family)
MVFFLLSCKTDKSTLSTDESPQCTDIDGNVYKVIKIGNQWWMAENLKVTHYRNGDEIFFVQNASTWVGLSSGAYGNYNDDINNGDTFGRLYNWFAVDDNRNIAPEGWHIASDDEWKELEIYLGISQSQADSTGWRGSNQGGKLKESGIVHWLNPNTAATNSSGFNALPGGFQNGSGSYMDLNKEGRWWTAPESGSSNFWQRRLFFENGKIYRFGTAGYRSFGFSVSCIKD